MGDGGRTRPKEWCKVLISLRLVLSMRLAARGYYVLLMVLGHTNQCRLLCLQQVALVYRITNLVDVFDVYEWIMPASQSIQ